MNDAQNPMILFDAGQRLRAAARGRAMGTDGDFLRAEVAARLEDRLLDINRRFEAVADLGGNFLPHVGMPGQPVAVQEPALALDAGSCDLVISNLCLHWVNDLPGILVQANQALRPDGLFLGALFGGETLHELRHCLLAAEADITGGAAQRISPFADVRDLGSLLQRAGFALPVADMDTITVSYEHPLKLMQDLRAMGETNALTDRSRNFLRRDVLMRACEIYMERHAGPDGRVGATFQVLYMTGWHPHESQQKPAKRGSGQVNLADALKAAVGKDQ
ncbi:MAG: methyltransferase domain-containing protein [Alphaproteobacteria bacterium]|nr:MAG: methyltransferase domain-containing protein [Alphaproteobacteria bacterium]